MPLPRTIASEDSVRVASAHSASPRRIDWRSLDVAMAVAVAMNVVGSIISAKLSSGWTSAAMLDGLVCVYLLALLTRPAWRPPVARLLLVSVVAGMLELGTDAAGEYFARSLVYPSHEPMLWASPIYMPVAWTVVLAPFAYLGWRLTGQRVAHALAIAMLVTSSCSALIIPFYEEMAFAAGWWRYSTPSRIGHTPLYVILFEGLIGAVLPLLARDLPAIAPRRAALRGAVLGGWILCAALAAWLLLGRGA